MAEPRHFPLPRLRVTDAPFTLTLDRVALTVFSACALAGAVLFVWLTGRWGEIDRVTWMTAGVVTVGAAIALAGVLLEALRLARWALVTALWIAAALPVGLNGWSLGSGSMLLVAIVVAGAILGTRAAVGVSMGTALVMVASRAGWFHQGQPPAAQAPLSQIEVLCFGALVVIWWSWRAEQSAIGYQRLRESLDASTTLRVAVESSRAGVGVADRQGRLTYVNRSLLEMWRIGHLREVLGRDIGEFWDDPADANAQLRRLIAGEIEVAVLSARRRDGSVFEVEMTAAEVVDDEGRARGVIGSFLDVSERNIAERQLAVERERTRAIVESVLDIVMIIEPHGTIVFENAAVERVLGFRAGARVGQSVFDHAHPDDLARVAAMMAELVEHPDRPARVPIRFRHQDGTWRWLETAARNLSHVPAIGGILGVAHDITEQRDLQARLEAGDRLETVGRLAGGVAHDFNNLLTAILGNAELARALPGSPQPMRRYLDGVISAGERARDLTRKLLAFARRERTQPAVIDLAARVTEAGDLLERLLGGEIRLDVQAQSGPLPVLIDPVQFEQILLNLAVNARDAMPDGGTFAIRAERLDGRDADPTFVGAVPQGAVARLLVRDTGTGMSPETMARIFEPFFTTKELGRGTGLGLSTVYGAVSQAQGAIRVASRLGEGTTFEVVFPLADVSLVNEQDSTRDDAQAPVTVLVVDDDDEVRSFVSEVLMSAGYQVLTAKDGADGMRVIDAHAADIALVVTDVVMPNGGGPEVAAHYQALKPGGPVLFITGFTFDASFEAQAGSMGAAILSKPFTIDHLLGQVRAQLRRGRQRAGVHLR